MSVILALGRHRQEEEKQNQTNRKQTKKQKTSKQKNKLRAQRKLPKYGGYREQPEKLGPREVMGVGHLGVLPNRVHSVGQTKQNKNLHLVKKTETEQEKSDGFGDFEG